jgi:integrase
MPKDIKLTNQALQNAVRIDDKDTEYRIIGKPYLRAVVGKTGISFRVKANHKGRRTSTTIGRFGCINLKAFEKKGTEWYQRQFDNNGSDYSKVTMDQFFFEIHLPYSKQRNTDWRATQRQYNQHIRPHLGNLLFQEIRVPQIISVLNCVAESGLSSATYNRIRSLIHRTFSLGVKFGVLDRNPCTVVERLSEDNVVERHLSPLEIPVFIESCLNETHSLIGQAVLFALFVGGRINNIITLRKTDIAPDTSTITFTRTKNKRKQVIPLSIQAKSILKQALSLSDPDSDFVFSSTRSASGHIAYPIATFKRICARAKIATTGGDYQIHPSFPKAPLTIHCLRKSFGSAVLAHTRDIHCSSKLLGHSSVEVTSSRYAFYQQEHLQEAVEGAASLLTKSVPNFPKIE